MVAFGLPMSIPGKAHAAAFEAIAPEQLDSWLAVAEDGSVTAFTGRIDMGTGVETVYTQAVAEELDVPVSAVKFVMGDTARTPEQGKSTASNSVMLNLPPMRQAAAEARLTLLELASAKLGVPVQDLTVKDGVVSVRSNPGQSVKYGDLIGGKRFNITVGIKGSGITTQLLGRATLKDPKEFKVLGTSVPRVDIPSKVRGEFKYIHDVTVEGMVHGAVVLPPERGAKLVSVDGFSRSIRGVIKVVTKGNFVGIVAETEWAAVQARNELKVTWSPGDSAGFNDIYTTIRNAPLAQDMTEAQVGDAAASLGKAETVLEATYHLPFNSHGMMGPSCAIADFQGDTLTLWAGTQWPDGTRRDVAAMMGLPVENVRLIWFEGAGSYGRLGVDDSAGDAALLSQAVGRPVRLQWQRTDEHGWAPFNPGAVIKVRAGLDKNNTVTAWDFESWTPSHSTGERGNILAWRALGTNPGHPRLSGGADKPSYPFANMRVTTHYTKEILRAVYMRSVGGIQNTFAIESMMDDLAAKAGIDPVEFRSRHLTDERAKAVLKAAAAKANWKPAHKSSGKGDIVSGRGVALCANNASTGSIATIIDIDVNKRTGEIRLKRAFVAFDVGRIANPDGLRHQIEGGTIMGMSRALKEEVLFDGAAVASVDWATYPVLQFSEVPESIEVVMIDSDNPPLGAGEPPNITPAPAIANAVFAATGVRLYSLPLTPDRVKSALSA
ncbi:MAG: molybdopterin-binding domain of aldehyde dehydrogenase family protein [Rhodospirillales bacterium]|nr:molybdopterin-binding domain of aldehyde dehydrogenase family protein [Rhodospirillales bacterium]